MTQVITIAGEKLFAAKAQANQQLDIDTFIFANVAGQDPVVEIDRNEGIPSADIVHQQNVQQTGRINDNVVVYSTVLDSVTGPFEFNWVGLYSSVNQTLVAISHVPKVSKTITAPGSAGNTLNRNFGIEYSGIAELAGISVSPETWQLDFSARLSGMDELTRQLASDMNGKDWFIDDGFKIVPRSTANTFSVTPGIGYVSGLRVELKQEHILTLQTYPQFVYVDAYFDGNASSQWKPKVAFTVSNTEMDDYIDVSGTKHYVFKFAVIENPENINDLRKPRDVIGLKTKQYNTFEELLNSKDDFTQAQIVKTTEHTSGNKGGAEYKKDGSTGLANTGNELKFYDSQGVGWKINEAILSPNQLGGSKDTSGLSFVGGAFRITPNINGENTCSIIDDSAHDPINILGVTLDNYKVTVTHEQPLGESLTGAAIASVDETLAAKGIFIGGSVGSKLSNIEMYKRHECVIDWENKKVIDPFTSKSRYVVEDNVSNLALTHPEIVDGTAKLYNNRIGPDAFLDLINDKNVRLWPYKDIVVTCKYNGSDWSVSHSTSALSTAINYLGFNCSQEGNVITLSHPASLGASANPITSNGLASDHKQINIYNRSNVEVEMMYTKSGTVVAPVAGDEIIIRLEQVSWFYGQSTLDLGLIKISPALDFKNVRSSNNFWLMGANWMNKKVPN